ncbi:MAG TPA: hypothetical protein DDY88_07170 [Actinobacteria bacterium]|nr:hypothetical protein [Actinomycetota bacterium]
MKRCPACNLTKPASEFQCNRTKADGLQSHCRACMNATNTRWREANREQFREAVRVSALKHADRVAAWRAANAERITELGREASWKYKARKRANGIFVVTDKDLRRLLQSPCIGCGTTESIVPDHCIPISRGGRTSIGNLIPLCKTCNNRKRSRFLFEWKQIMNARSYAEVTQ